MPPRCSTGTENAQAPQRNPLRPLDLHSSGKSNGALSASAGAPAAAGCRRGHVLTPGPGRRRARGDQRLAHLLCENADVRLGVHAVVAAGNPVHPHRGVAQLRPAQRAFSSSVDASASHPCSLGALLARKSVSGPENRPGNTAPPAAPRAPPARCRRQSARAGGPGPRPRPARHGRAAPDPGAAPGSRRSSTSASGTRRPNGLRRMQRPAPPAALLRPPRRRSSPPPGAKPASAARERRGKQRCASPSSRRRLS